MTEHSTISLLDLETIKKTAEKESTFLAEDTDIIIEEETVSAESTSTQNQTFNPENINEMLTQLSSNPEETTKLLTESTQTFSPQIIQQAKDLLKNGQGQKLLDEMKQRGMDFTSLRKQLLDNQREIKGLNGKILNKTSSAILITIKRQLKVLNVPIDNIKLSACSNLKCSDPVELSCSRLAIGPLKDKSIKVWFNPEITGKNRRASKIVGFPIGGDILIINADGDLSESDFLQVEKVLE